MQDTLAAKRSVLTALIGQLPNNPAIIRSAKSLAQSFKPTVASSLERASQLAYRLYVGEEPALSLLVCQLLNDLTFGNDYNKWSWVERTLALECKLRMEMGQPAAAQACAAAIQATYAVGEPALLKVKQAALRYRMTGGLLREPQLAEAERLGDASLVAAYRLSQIEELLFVQALGGSAELPLPETELRLQRLLSQLRAGPRPQP